MTTFTIKKPEEDNRMKFYRYNGRWNHNGNGAVIEEEIWYLDKETPCGYWIVPDGWYHAPPRKWVSKTARKRYAYPDKQLAMRSLHARKERQYKILSSQTDLCLYVLGKLRHCKEQEMRKHDDVLENVQ